MESSMSKENAFTLAEVLITLTIISVVSALTVPTLTNRVNEKQTVEKVKTAYSLLSDAFSRAKIDNGDFESWDISEYNTKQGANKLQKYFEPYLKIAGQTKNACDLNISSLDGKTKWSYCQYVWSNPINLDNGMSLIFWSGGHLDNHRSAVIVDINGLVAPNQLGLDMFQFNISTLTNSFYPSGTKETFGEVSDLASRCNIKSSGENNGKDCTAWVIYRGNMDYKRRSVKWED